MIWLTIISNNWFYVQVERYSTNSIEDKLNSMAKHLHESKFIDVNTKKKNNIML